MTETLVEKHMRLLNISKEEAEELIRADKEVDKMSNKEVSSDLTAEQVKAVKKYANIGAKAQTVYKFDTSNKVRKVDNEKAEFIAKLAEFVTQFGENVQIVKAEREISFTFGENSYGLTLTKHRK